MAKTQSNITGGRTEKSTGMRRFRIALWGLASLLAALFFLGLVAGVMDARQRKGAESAVTPSVRHEVDHAATGAPLPASVSPAPKHPIQSVAEEVTALVSRDEALQAKAKGGGGLKALDTSSLNQLEVDLVEVDSKLSDLEDRLASPRQMAGLPATFSVSGEVKDVTALGLVVWGQALPQKPGVLPLANGMSGTVMEESNLLIEKPARPVDVGGIYVGENIFLGRGTGRNRFGAEVPVWRYGTVVALNQDQEGLLSTALAAHEAAKKCRIENSSIIPDVHDEQEKRKSAAPRAP